MLVDPAVAAELSDEFGRLVHLDVVLESGGGHRTDREQLDQLAALGPVVGADGVSKPAEFIGKIKFN